MKRIMLIGLLLVALPATAQHGPHRHGASPTPYAGFQGREAAGLTTQEAADLRAGRGMGFALPAELNGHPGPLHALELAERLGLSAEQRVMFTAQMDAMRAETIPLGEALIQAERALDAVFRRAAATGVPATAAQVDAATQAAALARGQVRAAHLRIHLATAAAMSAEQRAAYARLRGYAPP